MYLSVVWCTLVGMNSGEGWRLGHRPALDGLRGVAVLLVVVSHGLTLAFKPIAHLTALGPIGVGIFFTLSGFLITSLLIGDEAKAGRIRFGRFYRRRALRLFPALAALVLAEVVVTLAWRHDFVNAGSVVATVLYVQNWFGIGGNPAGGLNHTWSLSIEEQFYLVWPLVFAILIRYGWRVVAGVAMLTSALSIIWRDHLYESGADPWRLYAGTDTRAESLLIGCALALVMANVVRNQRARPGLFIGGMAAIASIGWMGGAIYQVLLPLVTTLGTAAAIFGVAQGAGFRPLEARWLVWCGQRSYGMYLWHVPLMALLVTTDLLIPARLAIYVVCTFALTVLSWRYIETPFLRLKGSGDTRGAAQELVRAHPHRARPAVAAVEADV
jgi:peptidoglycan/LPS O-acetylase OafA/YrhL